jgi:hypothetical protein
MGLPACACRYYYGFKHINYNYRYVLENIEFMCPEPWRLPLTREIIAAKKWLGAYERDTTELWAKGFGNYPTEHSVETFQEGHELWDIETLVFFKTEYDVDNPKFPLLYDFFANQRHLVRCILEQ